MCVWYLNLNSGLVIDIKEYIVKGYKWLSSVYLFSLYVGNFSQAAIHHLRREKS